MPTGALRKEVGSPNLPAMSWYLLICVFPSGRGNRKMSSHKWLFSTFAVLWCLSLSVSAADKKSKEVKPDEAGRPSYELPQPATENLDFTMYQRIRDEGLAHSHVMEFASALADGIGPRLTGSPNLKRANEWTRDQFTAMGCSNAHLEDWGEFGMGWQQLNTWVRMTEPDTAVFVAQATPWSPSTKGPVTAQAVSVVVDDASDVGKYKGKLSGKIVLLGAMRDVPVPDKPFFERYSDKDLKDLESLPLEGNDGAAQARERYIKRTKLLKELLPLLAEEKVAGVIVPSRDGMNGGGTGIIFDDNGAALGRTPYHKDTAISFPVVVAQIESYGRVFRLLQNHVPVSIEMDVETKFTGDHEHGFDTIAEIPGTDPKLKDEVVMG